MPPLKEMLEGLICPQCGRADTYVVENIEHVVRVGDNTIFVSVTVGVCTFCGEKAYDKTATDAIDDATRTLEAHDMTHLVHVGETFRYR